MEYLLPGIKVIKHTDYSKTITVCPCPHPPLPYLHTTPHPLCLQSQASSSNLGKQLAQVESLLQKQDLLEAQISAHGETITTFSRAALKVLLLYICLFSKVFIDINDTHFSSEG